MKKQSLFYRSISLLLILCLLFTGCGKEKPPLNSLLPQDDHSNSIGQPTEDITLKEFATSKALDYSPCKGIRVTAQENAFWQDTVVEFKPVDDTTKNITEIEQKLYDEEGFLMFAGFEVDAGLSDDEIIPGQYDVEYDLKTSDIDPEMYEFLKVYRVGENGSYYELSSDVEGDILRFSCNQNSVFAIGGSFVLAGLSIGAAGKEYYERNVYFIGNGKDVLKYDGENIYGKWTIEWTSEDIDPDLAEHLKRMREIEEKYKQEAENEFAEDELLSISDKLILNRQICNYALTGIKNDAEHKKLQEQIKLPDLIKTTNSYIDNAFRYLRQEEKMKMPLHRVPFKFIRDEKKYYGVANNRALSSAYIDINLNYVNPTNKNDMYNLQMTLVHELLHICQNRYVSDDTRYNEMAAQVMEADALAYFKRKDIIPETANLELTRSDYWGNLRLPINGEEDSNLDAEIRQDEIINCGYNLGSFARYLIEKTGKRPLIHTIMNSRSYFTSGVSEPLCSAFEIDERAFDMYFRNWVISNRENIAGNSLKYVIDRMYGFEKSTIVSKGGKYHKDLLHGSSYFLNIRTFEIPKTEKDTAMILVPDKDLLDVFPSANIGTGIPYKNITAGQYIDSFLIYSNALPNLFIPVLEIQGDSSDQNRSKNAGYTIYVLDKTPKVELSFTEDKLEIKLPKPEIIAEDGVADGYLLKISTDTGLTKETEIPITKAGRTFELSRMALYDGNTDADVTVTATLNEYFLDSSGNKIMGIESDKAVLLVPKIEKDENQPADNSQQTEEDNDEPKEGYWRLKETNVTPGEDEIGTDGYASFYYSASELSHTKRVSQPSTVYHGAGSATLTVTCSAPPQIIRPGEDVVMHLSVDGSYSGYYLLWSASGSVKYGAPNDERNAIMYNRGTRFAALEEGGKEYVYLDPYGNDPSPETTVVHVFDKGTRAGSEMAILFTTSYSNTLWIYEWVE